MGNYEQLQQWFSQYDTIESNLNFETLQDKLHPCEQVSAILFLASKLKDKNEKWFLHGEHDTLYIGRSYDIFEDFTEEDVRIAVSHGIYLADDGDGFQMYASM